MDDNMTEQESYETKFLSIFREYFKRKEKGRIVFTVPYYNKIMYFLLQDNLKDIIKKAIIELIEKLFELSIQSNKDNIKIHIAITLIDQDKKTTIDIE
ncbi:MAG: hypothetical protein DRJ03_28100 [Chloroflexi bacterium]|nr:MAG: hypothetical protein DRJ03_28100 [Chloroflexota bacterium]